MKEIRMPYSEYEEMIKLIKEQEDFINEFKKDSKVVLIVSELSYGITNRLIPRIITTDELLAKEYLKEEFNKLSNSVKELNSRYFNLQKDERHKEEKKKSWWSF